MTKASPRFSSMVRTLVASLVAWPVPGLLMSLVFSQPSQSASESLGVWTLTLRWLWVNLLALPAYGSVFCGHFVFIAGLFQLAELTRQKQVGRKALLFVAATLSVGILLKTASYLVLLPDTWGIALLLLDSLIAICVIFLTRPRVNESSLVLDK